MSEEELFRKVKKTKKERDEAFAELKGMFQGIRLGKLSSVDKSFVKIVEMMTKGFKNLGDDIIGVFERQIKMVQKVNNLEKKLKDLETNILDLRLTLDKMAQDR